MHQSFTDFHIRLSSTVTLIVFCSVSIFYMSFAWFIPVPEDAIKCWYPEYFTASMEHYAQQHCWKTRSEWYDFATSIARDESDTGNLTESVETTPLQLVTSFPLLLLVLGASTFIPLVFYRCLLRLRIQDPDDTLRDMAVNFGSASHVALVTLDARKQCALVVARNMSAQLSHCKGFLVLSQLILKVLYAVMPLIMFGILSLHFGRNVYELTTVDNSKQGLAPMPKQCDFEARRLGTVERYAVQCDLTKATDPRPEILQYLVLFVWGWLWVMFIVNTCCTLAYIVRVVLAPKLSFARLVSSGMKGESSEKGNEVKSSGSDEVNEFLRILGVDGLIWIDDIARKVSTVGATEVVDALWNEFHGTGDQPEHASSAL